MKIVFITSNIQLPRVVRRINEFVERGYDAEVYYFNRTEFVNKSDKIKAPLHQIGEVSSAPSSYIKRIPSEYRNIRKVVQNYKGKDIVFYLFGIDIALLFPYTKNGFHYIYEESDLRHTYIKNSATVKFFEYFDKKIIRNSLLTVFTSEGFCKYHFGDNIPSNVTFITNRLSPSIKNYPIKEHKVFNADRISIGFVGSPRYKSVCNFVRILCENFPQNEFHFYGEPIAENLEVLRKYSNCYFHGAFTNPQDLPNIYQNIDLVLATYDTDFENVRYAEPNKLYEAMYFEVPIIVSSGTFLADKVNQLGIGFDIDAYNDEEVKFFLTNITNDKIQGKLNCIQKVQKDALLSINDAVFNQLELMINRTKYESLANK